MNHLVYKMSDNNETCPPQSPRDSFNSCSHWRNWHQRISGIITLKRLQLYIQHLHTMWLVSQFPSTQVLFSSTRNLPSYIDASHHYFQWILALTVALYWHKIRKDSFKPPQTNRHRQQESALVFTKKKKVSSLFFLICSFLLCEQS